MLSWGGGNPQDRLQGLLQVVSRLLQPDMGDSASLYVGSLIHQLLLNMPAQVCLHNRHACVQCPQMYLCSWCAGNVFTTSALVTSASLTWNGSRHLENQVWDFVPGLNLNWNKPACSCCIFSSADGHGIKKRASPMAIWHDLPLPIQTDATVCAQLYINSHGSHAHSPSLHAQQQQNGSNLEYNLYCRWVQLCQRY